ncbi:uncharacterized protein LOC143544026 [Bidens hawaiensis]|uniref:uncharacterized protein LOC143544026 n=1 Tax=Bidens hawaiensis TaxID=980011 RepID=UPI00404B3194
MTNTRNQEVDNTLKDHGKAISDLQETLAALMKQQEQSLKQQEEILRAFKEHSSGGSFSGVGGGSFSGGGGSGKGLFSDADSRVGIRPMRVGKVEFPKFSGVDVEGWINRCEHFFTINETPANLKLRHAVIHLEGDAIEWHQSYMKTRGLTVAKLPWEDYVLAISASFSNAMFEDAMEEIASLVQIADDIDGLRDYNSGFDRLLNKVTISEPYVVSLYVKGLKLGIKGPVKMFKPQTLHEAYGLARIQTINNTSLMNRLKSVEDDSQCEDTKITPPFNASKLPLIPSPTNVQPTSEPGTLSSRRLTSDELELKRAKGECFWCTEKFVPGHNCTKRQLYILQVIDDEDQAPKGWIIFKLRIMI